MESSDMKNFATLMIGLFVIMVVAALVYIGAGFLKEVACELNTDDAHLWSDETCVESSTNATEITVKAVTKLNIIEGVIDIVLALLTLVVIVSIFKIVVKTAKGF